MACRVVCPSSLLVALAAAVLISACGGSSNTSANTSGGHTVTVVHTVTGGSGSTTATGASTSTTATTTTTAPSGPPACASGQLTALSLGSNGAAGTIMYYFALRNTSGKPCHTYGWPGASFLASNGTMLPTKVTRTTTDMSGTVKPTAITLKGGQEASFRVAVSQAYNGGADCKTASFLQIYAPDDTVAMRVAIKNGAQACGKATVTPLEKGKAAVS